MVQKIGVIVGVLALLVCAPSAIADDRDHLESDATNLSNHESKKHKEHKGKKEKPKRGGGKELDGRTESAERGQKRGWVDGRPPGQTKKFGYGENRHHVEREGDDTAHGYSEQAETDGSELSQTPASTEDILTDMAKQEAARRAGAAPGSAEEALINIGADAILERTRRD